MSIIHSSSSKLNEALEALFAIRPWLSGRNYLTRTMTIPGQGYTPCSKKSTIEQTIHRIKVGDHGWHESAFFRVKAFKKGTVHLEFLDEALWAGFNILENKGKNAIGESDAALKKRIWIHQISTQHLSSSSGPSVPSSLPSYR